MDAKRIEYSTRKEDRAAELLVFPEGWFGAVRGWGESVLLKRPGGRELYVFLTARRWSPFDLKRWMHLQKRHWMGRGLVAFRASIVIPRILQYVSPPA